MPHFREPLLIGRVIVISKDPLNNLNQPDWLIEHFLQAQSTISGNLMA